MPRDMSQECASGVHRHTPDDKLSLQTSCALLQRATVLCLCDGYVATAQSSLFLMIAFLISLFCERALQKRLYLCELLQRATVLRLFDVCCATAQSSLDWFEGDLDAGRASVSMYSSKCIQAILCISKCIQAMHSIA